MGTRKRISSKTEKVNVDKLIEKQQRVKKVWTEAIKEWMDNGSTYEEAKKKVQDKLKLKNFQRQMSAIK